MAGLAGATERVCDFFAISVPIIVRQIGPIAAVRVAFALPFASAREYRHVDNELPINASGFDLYVNNFYCFWRCDANRAIILLLARAYATEFAVRVDGADKKKLWSRSSSINLLFDLLV